MKKKIILFCLFSFIFQIEILHAQISPIEDIFNQDNYSFYSADSNNYIMNESFNYPVLTSMINTASPFNTQDFYADLSQVNADSNLHLMYGLHQQVPNHDSLYTECYFNFNYKNINSKWYAFYKKSIVDTNIAFLVVPGSGTFQSLKIAEGDPNNYHNLNGVVRDKCLQYGDFYVYSKINQEFRSFWRRNPIGGCQRLDYDYLTPYTDFNGKHWAANMYIELVAAVKALKKKYKRVFVLGLSNAGFPVLISGIYGEADGIGCAAGISTWSYNGFSLPNNENPYFSGILEQYSLDSIRTLVQKAQSRFLFSYGAGDGGGNANEHITHALQDSLNSPCNADFFYDFVGHTFPTVAYDSFFTKVIRTPKVDVQLVASSDCNADSAIIHIEYAGAFPLFYDLYYNNVFVRTDTLLTPTRDINIVNEGVYQLRNLVDSFAIPLCRTKEIHYLKKVNSTFSIVHNGYICSQQKDSMTLTIHGKSPFYYHWNDNGMLSYILSVDSVIGIKTGSGNYGILDIVDSNLCLTNVNHTFVTTIDTFHATIDSATYNCFANQNEIAFSLHGKKPFTMQYFIGTNFNTSTINNTQFLWTPNNGQYFIAAIHDSNNCSQLFNSVIEFNNQPLTCIMDTPVYSCDSAKYTSHFVCTGRPPFLVKYVENSVNKTLLSNTMQFDFVYQNGNTYFTEITDSNHCSTPLTGNYNVQAAHLISTMSSPQYNCDSNKTLIHFAFQGNSPWIVHYTENGINKEIQTSQNTLDKYFETGAYYFLTVNDSTGCSVLLNKYYTFFFHAINGSLSTEVFNCTTHLMEQDFILDGNKPFTVSYTQDGILNQFTTSNYSTTQSFVNGDYHFLTLTDSTGCLYNLNTSKQFNIDTLDTQLSTPMYVCDSNKTLIHFSFQGNAPWTVFYIENGINKQFQTTQNALDKYFDNGIYQFVSCQDITNCSISLNQFYNFSFHPLIANLPNEVFNCTTHLMEQSFSLDGNKPFAISYTKDGTPNQFTTSDYFTTPSFSNGEYHFLAVTDSTGCSFEIDITKQFNGDTLHVQTTEPLYSCDSNKTLIHFDFQGNSPWTIFYLENGINKQFQTTQNAVDIYFSNGTYQFLSCINSSSCSLPLNLFYTFNFAPLQVILSNEIFNCSSNLTDLPFTFNGNKPFTVSYTKNGIPNQWVSSNYSAIASFTNGDYSFNTVVDSTGCSVDINSVMQFNRDTLQVQMSQALYDCDSNKNLIHFDFQGNSPWTVSYNENGMIQQFQTNQNSIDKYFGNGNFNFMYVTDSTSCNYNLNVQYLFNNTPLAATIVQQLYDCDSNKYRIDFSLEGNAPWIIEYQNGSTLYRDTTWDALAKIYLQNGNWTINSVQDAKQCSIPFGTTLTVNYTPLQVLFGNAVYDCDSNKMKVNIALQGNGPWTMYYQKFGMQNIIDSIQTSISSSTFYYSIGSYFVYQVVDNNQCSINPNYYTTNNHVALQAQKINTKYNCDSSKLQIDYALTGTPPFSMLVKNNLTNQFDIVTANTGSMLVLLPPGTFTIFSITDANCTKMMNDTIQSDIFPLISQVNAGIIDCDSGKSKIQFVTTSGLKPYAYNYYENTVLKNFVSNTDTASIYVTPGNYFIEKITDANNCQISYNQNYVATYTPSTFQGVTQKYLCDKDSTAIHFDIQPNSKNVDLIYTYNHIGLDTFKIANQESMQASNGLYHWNAIVDSNDCVYEISDSTIIYNRPNHFLTNSIELNCVDQDYIYHIALQGKSPWILNYNLNNVFNTMTITDSIFDWHVGSGDYYLIQTKDANQCDYKIEERDTLIHIADIYPILTATQRQLETIHVPYAYYWYRNNVLIDSLSTYSIMSYGSGTYYVAIKDSAGCIFTSNAVSLNYPSFVSLFPNPTSSLAVITIDDEIVGPWQYSLLDLSGHVLITQEMLKPSVELDMKKYADGLYTVAIRYSSKNKLGIQKYALPLLKK